MASTRARVATVAGLALAAVAILRTFAGDDGAVRGRPHPAPATRAGQVPAAPTSAASAGRDPQAPARSVPRAPPVAPEDEEAVLTARLRALVDADPAAAIAIGEEGERRFPGGALADERSYLKMRALVHLDRIGDARSEAEAFFERFPGSGFGEDAFRLTGVHPRPRPPPVRGSGQ